MAIKRESLLSKSLTPTDFAKLALGQRQQTYQDLTTITHLQGQRRRLSLSDGEDELEKETTYRIYKSKDYIETARLTLQCIEQHMGFSAFFLAFVGSCPSLARRLVKVQESDDVFTQKFKESFFCGFISKVISCHALSMDETTRPRITVADFYPFLPYTYDYAQRSERLTKRTVEKAAKPYRLKFPYQTPEEIPKGTDPREIERFFATREAAVNLRESEHLWEQPRAIEYFEKFLSRVGMNFERLAPEMKVSLLPREFKGGPDEDMISISMYLHMSCRSQVFEDELSKYFVLLRGRDWACNEDMLYFPSPSLELSNRRGERASYDLISIVSVTETNVMEYQCAMIDPKGTGSVWSKDNPSFYKDFNFKSSLERAERSLARGKLDQRALLGLSNIIAVCENVDCVFYKRG